MLTTTLFCLPHAGGSSSNYLTWKRFLPPHIVVQPLELPGRGKRIADPLYTSITEAVDDLYARIAEEVDKSPYAFFGHSMGTLLIYELVRKIRACQRPEPVHVFFSGRFPPFIHDDDRERIHTLSDEHFIEKVCQLGGTNRKVFENKELLDMFLPVLRADYGIVERYRHPADGVQKLACDITIFSGRRDEHAHGAPLQRWQECTVKTCTFHEFDGDHFFIQPFKAEIAAIIHRTLTSQSVAEKSGNRGSHNENNQFQRGAWTMKREKIGVADFENVAAVEMMPGVLRRTLVYNDDMMMCHFTAEAGVTLDPHRHEAVQSGHVLKGKIRFRKADGTTFIAQAGTSYIFDANELHGIEEVCEPSELIECFTPFRPEYV